MEHELKEVDFYSYCPKCENYAKKENEDPCWDCLTEGVNENSHKPTHFEEVGT